MKNYFLLIIAILFLYSNLHAEVITGSACYRYSDNESVNEARDIALSMAKRSALEGYAIFVESTATVENQVLKNDLISSLTAGLLKNLRITQKSEDLQKKEICIVITADVEPIEIRQRVVSKINTFRRKNSNFQTGLPENDKLKVLKVQEGTCGNKYNSGNCLMIITRCKYDFGTRVMRIIYYDKDGIPSGMDKSGKSCNVGDIMVFYLKLPKDPSNTYSFEIAR